VKGLRSESGCSVLPAPVLTRLSLLHCIAFAPGQISIGWLDVMAHACNPSYLGSRDWEEHGLRPAWAKC
jgi:hypothetical protein